MPTTPPAPEPESGAPPFRYGAALAGEIERKWQDRWEAQRLFRAPNPGEPGFDPARPKKYVLDMFPYPSGVGLHVGHPLGYIATDIYARFLRMTGHNVLHAMGYDAFGLPAEQFAVQTGQHPRVTTEKNIANMRRQLRRLGLAHDDRRSVATTDVPFYRWTQWIFLQIYNSWYDDRADRARPISELEAALDRGMRPCAHPVHNPQGRAWKDLPAAARRAIIDSHRLAYLDEVPVNWCPALGTVLANEEVTSEGRSERGDHPVFKRPMRQWMMRITAYAHRLLTDLDALDWPDAIKQMQRNWIGRSEGARVRFPVPGAEHEIEVFTTRPDTIFGATYMVLAPEHPLVDSLTPAHWPHGCPDPWKGPDPARSPRQAVAMYRAQAAARTEVQRQADAKDKTGVFTGAYATNPASGERIPIFIADYVLMGYGTGAIMAVPAHDERDYEFARQFGLPMRDVVYSSTAMRIKAFTEAVRDPSVFAEGWFVALADFVGLATSLDAPFQDSADLIERVRTNRVEEVMLERGVGGAGHAGPVGASRLAIREVWMETLAYLRDVPWERLVGAFRGATYRALRGGAHTTIGWMVNSPPIEGMRTGDAKQAATDWLEKKGCAEFAVTYKLRDWLFSRQRYWGEPFPIVYDADGAAHALPESMLPVTLPEMENFQPEPCDENDPTCAAVPRPPLARAADWSSVTLDLGAGPRRYTRELNTMPQWAGSCWYYLRYLDPENNARFCDPEVEKYWMTTTLSGALQPGGVDLYVGGVEHAVLHLLYARFWHKALYDLGHVCSPEPFQRLFNQGYIQAYAYRDERGVYVDAERVEEDPARPGRFLFEGRPLTREYGKMGKSLKNAVAPDDICDSFGADTLRLYEMYLGPLEQSKPWSTRDIVGVHRFLQRAWRACVNEDTGAAHVADAPADPDTRRLLHKTIAGVREDMARLSFNTAIAKLIELTNHLTRLPATPREAAAALAHMLSPLAPHFADELWERLGGRGPLAFAPFPAPDAELLVDNVIEIPVQVLGKLRGRIRVSATADQAAIETAALADEKVRPFVEGREIRKIVYIPGRLVNIVTG